MLSVTSRFANGRRGRGPVDPGEVDVHFEPVDGQEAPADDQLLRQERVDARRRERIVRGGEAARGAWLSHAYVTGERRVEVQGERELSPVDDRERSATPERHTRADLRIADRREVSAHLVAKLGLGHGGEVGGSRDVEAPIRSRHEREASSNLEPRPRRDGEVGRKIDPLIAIVVELPPGLVLRQIADAGQAVVGQVEREPERDGHTEDATGQDNATHETRDGIDVVALPVRLELGGRAEVADGDLEPLGERQTRRVVITRREVTRVGGLRISHRRATRSEPEGVEGIRACVRGGTEQHATEEREAKLHQNPTPT